MRKGGGEREREEGEEGEKFVTGKVGERRNKIVESEEEIEKR